MAFIAFTLAEAEEICEDFEDLVDTEFKVGSSPVLLVAAVLIAPFNEADKNSFVESYYAVKDHEQAITFYAGSDYDVLLVTCEADDEANYSYIGIREFAELRGIKYSFPE